MASLLTLLLKWTRSCPLWAKVFVVVTVASLGVKLLIAPRGPSKNQGIGTREWETFPWFQEGGIKNGGFQNASIEQDALFDDFKLLFVGNSYTSVNDLAGLTKKIIDSQHDADINIRSHHPGGQTFRGHVLSTAEDYKPPHGSDDSFHPRELREWLVTKPLNYNWVILQEQSQIPGFSGTAHDDLFFVSKGSCYTLNKMVQQGIPNAQTMFYMTWGRRAGDDMNRDIYPDFLSHQARLTKGYEQYLEKTSTEQRPTWVAPVGLVYQNIYNSIKERQGIDPGNTTDCLFYQLYMDDGSHPSIYGSYLAALTMYTSMTGADPRQVQWMPPGVEPEVATQIQQAVAWTVMETVTMGMNYPWLMDDADPVDQLP
ncbi:expressed unknown protein [Seminavis robusta]|uniref:Uncharacterized protein n=1 Tax=Seminavis robusta TaxID=568900 RepID=A0A9N8EV17_9STRA|nr:expressed unknown protein [Seminavis robusta]|eukprot:Sro1769_g296450.1 n/a (370) ;mRNA; r:9599-10708